MNTTTPQHKLLALADIMSDSIGTSGCDVRRWADNLHAIAAALPPDHSVDANKMGATDNGQGLRDRPHLPAHISTAIETYGNARADGEISAVHIAYKGLLIQLREWGADLATHTPQQERAGVPEGCTPADAQMLREANHALAEENARLRRGVVDAFKAPDDWALVPQKMYIDAATWELMVGYFGGPGSTTDPAEPYLDCVLWVGKLDGDGDVPDAYGLHIYCDECPEEGSSTVFEFDAPAAPATPESAEPVNREIATWLMQRFKNCGIKVHERMESDLRMFFENACAKLYTHPTPAASDGGLREAFRVYVTTMKASNGTFYTVTADNGQRAPDATLFDSEGRIEIYTTEVLSQAEHVARQWDAFLHHREFDLFESMLRDPTPPTEQTKPSEAAPLARISGDVRAALLFALWRHLGGSSPVGQPLRAILGIGTHAHLDDDQLADAKRVQAALNPEPVAAPAQVTDATLEACCKVVRDLSSDVRHSILVDGYTEPQRRFLGSIADRIESAALLGGAVALRAAQPDAGGVVDTAETNILLCAFARHWRLDGDYLRCKACERPQLTTHAAKEFPHAADCKLAGVTEPHPWHALARLLMPLAGQQKGGGR